MSQLDYNVGYMVDFNIERDIFANNQILRTSEFEILILDSFLKFGIDMLKSKQAKQNFISMTSHRLINVHWKINTYIIYKMVIAGDIRRQIYVYLGCPPFMADLINEQKQ